MEQSSGGSNPLFRTNKINDLQTAPDQLWDSRLVRLWEKRWDSYFPRSAVTGISPFRNPIDHDDFPATVECPRGQSWTAYSAAPAGLVVRLSRGFGGPHLKGRTALGGKRDRTPREETPRGKGNPSALRGKRRAANSLRTLESPSARSCLRWS